MDQMNKRNSENNKSEFRKPEYEKPKMKFTELYCKTAVANTCWGYASNGSGGDLYYNSPGYGWVNFYVTGESCKKTGSVVSYTIKGYKDGMTDEQKTAAKAALADYWATTGANGGSPFQGSSSDYSEGGPGGNWS